MLAYEHGQKHGSTELVLLEIKRVGPVENVARHVLRHQLNKLSMSTIIVCDNILRNCNLYSIKTKTKCREREIKNQKQKPEGGGA